jgi:sugar lactone lactonase YvrE
MQRLAYLLVSLLVVACGGMRLEDRTTAPRLPATALELVAALDHPPGNVAVSRSGRVFVTLHPAGAPPVKVVELVGGQPVPWPDARYQQPSDDLPWFDTPLSIRIDGQERLWVLDYARYGRGQPRLLAFDVGSGALVHQYDFPSEVAGFLSMLNDLQVDPGGKTIYIAETSPILQRPALVVYDVEQRTARRLLESHPSVTAENYVIQTPGRDMVILGFYTIRIGVDSIALDRRGEWLYYGPFSGERLHRVPTRALRDPALAPDALAATVEDFAPKTISDGLTSDDADTIYITDPEHSAVLTLDRNRTLRTLVKDAQLRWPDGLGFGPDGWLYVTCSALHHVMFRTTSHMRSHAPFHVFRFRPGGQAAPGH